MQVLPAFFPWPAHLPNQDVSGSNLTHFGPAQTPAGSCCEHSRPVIVT
jgi:hypothetical protein